MDERGIAPRVLVLILVIIIIGGVVAALVSFGPAGVKKSEAKTGIVFYENYFDFTTATSAVMLPENHAGIRYMLYDGIPQLCYNIKDMGVVSLESVTKAPENGYETSVVPEVGHTYCHKAVWENVTYAKFEVTAVENQVSVTFKWELF